MWLTVSALNLEGPWIDGLETYFIVLAFVGTALYGGSSLRTGLLPRWIGIAVILWAFGMLLVTLPGNRGPFNYTPALLLIAIALLARRGRVPLQE
jgi:hypothetical protein